MKVRLCIVYVKVAEAAVLLLSLVWSLFSNFLCCHSTK